MPSDGEPERFSGGDVTGKILSTEVTPSGPSIEVLLDFLNPKSINAALAEADWSVKKEIELYAAIVNDQHAADRDKMAAAAKLRGLVIDTLRLSGQLATIVSKQQVALPQDGNEPVLFQSVEMRRIVKSMNTEELLRSNRGGLGASEALALPSLKGEFDAPEQEYPEEEDPPDPAEESRDDRSEEIYGADPDDILPTGEGANLGPGAGGDGGSDTAAAADSHSRRSHDDPRSGEPRQGTGSDAEDGDCGDGGGPVEGDRDGGPDSPVGGDSGDGPGRRREDGGVVRLRGEESEPGSSGDGEGDGRSERGGTTRRPPRDPYPGLATGAGPEGSS